jgi:hypothetical protein
MMKISNKEHFEAWLNIQNIRAALFKDKIIDKDHVTYEDKILLLSRLEGQFSPENLCCDGELRGPALRAKTVMLLCAQAYLESL